MRNPFLLDTHQKSTKVDMPPNLRPAKTQSTKKDVGSQQRACDGCLDVLAEKDALKCPSCNVWLHCYCAGIPRSHFERIASEASFVCAACSLATNRTAATELKTEISALQLEVQELKTALMKEKQASQSLAKDLDELRRSHTVNTTQRTSTAERSYAAIASTKPRHGES